MYRSTRSKLNYTANSEINVKAAGLSSLSLTEHTDMQYGAEPFQAADAFEVDVISKSKYDCMDPMYRTKNIDLGSL